MKNFKNSTQHQLAVVKNAVIYCRVSSARQVTEGNGLESQKISCERYCRSKGYNVVKAFEDGAVSGGKYVRDGLSELIAFISSGTSYIVVVDDLNRLARDVMIGTNLCLQVREAGCTLESTTQKFDDTPTGNFMRSLYFGIAQLDREKNREQVVSRMDAQLSLGRRMFGKPPAWYKAQNRTIVPFQPNADIVKAIYNGLVSGELSKQNKELAAFMASRGFTNARGEPCKPTKHIAGSVLSENAIMESSGFVKYQGEWITAQHEAIITEDLAKRVLSKLNDKGKGKHRDGMNEFYPLRGLMLCDCCGNPMTASSPNKGDYHYYYCRTHGCEYRHINTRVEIGHQHFIALLQRATPSEQVLRITSKMFSDKWAETVVELAEDRRRLQNTLTDTKERIRSCLAQTHKVSEEVKKALYDEVEHLTKDREMLEQQLADSTYGEKDFETVLASVQDFLKNPCAAWIEGDLSQKRMVQRVMFPDGICYQPKSGFRNPEFALPFRLYSEINGGKANLVDPSGIEPLTSCMPCKRSTS
jgi:site-specific DNA recombinase